MPHRLAVTLVLALLATAGCSVFGVSSGGAGSAGGGGGGGGAANPGQPGVPDDGWRTWPTPGGTFGDAVPPADFPGDPPGGPPQPPDPAPGNPVIVMVHPGQANLRSAHLYELSSRIDGSGHVIVRVRWWGGIEPCEMLDSVLITRDGNRFSLNVRVGSPVGLNVACIEIARDTATLVDLGVLPSGTYAVFAEPGDAPPLMIAVP
jgi:hypothetical protein